MDKYMKANIVFSKFARDYTWLKKYLPIRQSEMAVINIITQRKERHTPLMIAELLGVSKPMVAALISSLEEKGYLTKETSDTDGRSFYLIPTEKAAELADDFNARQTEYLKNIESRIGEVNFDELIRLLDKTERAIANIREE